MLSCKFRVLSVSNRLLTRDFQTFSRYYCMPPFEFILSGSDALWNL